MAELKAEMIKWMFVFWLGSVLAISGVVYTCIRPFLK